MRTLSLLLGSLIALSSYAQKIVQVKTFIPSGLVGSADQVRIRFSDFIFSLGESSHAVPLWQIIYPSNQAILAYDPEIPATRQKYGFARLGPFNRVTGL